MQKITSSTNPEIIGNFLAYQDVLTGEQKRSTLQYSLGMPAAQRYAQALKALALQHTDEKVHHSAKSIHDRFKEAMKKIGIEHISLYSGSLSWAYWDLGKQYYFFQHPQETYDKYPNGDPITSDEIQESIVQRHLGWELHTHQFDFARFFGIKVPTEVSLILEKNGQLHSWEYTLIGKNVLAKM